MEEAEENNKLEKIMHNLKEKAALKQAIYRNTLGSFESFKRQAEVLLEEIQKERGDLDKNVVVEFNDVGTFEFETKLGGDLLAFVMHTNVFDFEKSHSVWQSSYVKEDISRTYCGMISIYNFLADSFKYNRLNDSGYLIGRLFINKEKHFFMEGKRKLNFLFNDFGKEVINDEIIKSIIETAILYSMSFDLITPPYNTVQEISAGDLIRSSSVMQLKTGKRLGYKFSFETDDEIE